jgi:hypothetical protein
MDDSMRGIRIQTNREVFLLRDLRPFFFLFLFSPEGDKNRYLTELPWKEVGCLSVRPPDAKNKW